MNDLIAALQIFAKYLPDERRPTACEHDVLYVCCDPAGVSEDDMAALEALGFFPDDEFGESFVSFRFGSC